MRGDIQKMAKKERLIIIVTIIVSFILIYAGNRLTMKDVNFFDKANDLIVGKAEVTKVLNESPNEYSAILFS